MNRLFTIGFTKKSAEQFFSLLRESGVTMVADVRLNNSGQLAGFTKAKDLAFFLSLVGIGYQHWKDFAPTKDLRTSYHSDWDFNKYAAEYSQLISNRGALAKVSESILKNESVCLLCSEATHEKCHRSIAAQLIATAHPGLVIMHL